LEHCGACARKADAVRNTLRIAPRIANRCAVLLALILISFTLDPESLVMFGSLLPVLREWAAKRITGAELYLW
jgi:hypothetical protein